MMFSMRFDMRSMRGPHALPDLYEAALEMAAFGEMRGCAALQVSEHHASPDGYLPAPLVLATALAARTRTLPIQVAALLLPLYDPVRLAEEMAVLDLLSRGRVSYVCALGYRPEEYAMFGREMKHRGRLMDEYLDVLLRALRGERFTWQGRAVQVTPTPVTPIESLLMLGGNSEPALQRAARFGLGMLTMGGDASLEARYLAACKAHGNTPGPFINPAADTPASCFVAEDVDAAWQELGPYLLHDARMYAAWMGDGTAITKSVAADLASLRAEQGNYRIFSVEEAALHIRERGNLAMQPLAGGIPPKLAWRSLELVASRVLPALSNPA